MTMTSKLLRRRRVFRLIAFLGVAGLIFVLFQIFSVEVLNNMSSDEANRMRIVAKHQIDLDSNEANMLPGNQQDLECLKDNRKCQKSQNNASAVVQAQNKLYLLDDGDDLSQNKPFRNGFGHVRQDHFLLDDNVVKPDSDSYENPDDPDQYGDGGYDEMAGRQAMAEEAGLEEVVVDETRLPAGVPRTMAQLYEPDEANMFMCIETKEQIDWSRVNDDYCDCGDSSDEPGTNACPRSKFYCKFQLAGTRDLKWVSGSKVNDGVCDCCDGSDEWLNRRLPDRLLLNDGKVHYGIQQGPCENRCSQLQAQFKQLSVIQQQGAVIKQQYLANLHGAAGVNSNKLYGKDGAYRMLAEECFTRSADKYQYTVCPFRDVKQYDGSSTTMIGHNGSWLSAHRLKMAGGDSHQCPGMRRRMSVIEFECSVQNQILSVQETEVCEYTFRFSTPAAC